MSCIHQGFFFWGGQKVINEFYSGEGKEGKTMSMFLSTHHQIIFLAGDFLSCWLQK